MIPKSFTVHASDGVESLSGIVFTMLVTITVGPELISTGIAY